jgi:outer membrane protein assembly factor BamB
MRVKLRFLIALTSCCVLVGLLLASIPEPVSRAGNNFIGFSAADGSRAVAYQIDPAHTGSQSDTVAPPLVERWSRNLGGPISYPLIAEGKVFVTIANQTPSGTSGSRLYALDAATGATSWGPIDISGSRPWSGIAYDAGRIFALNYDGLLRAFDAASGILFWQTRLVPETQVWAFDTPPTALGGLVYTAGARFGGTLFAVSQQDGSIRWTALVENGNASSPTVSAGGVYVSYICSQAYDFSPASGNLIWHHDSTCSGGGGATTVLFGGRLYSRDVSHLGSVVLNSNTGEEIGSFQADKTPAFSGSTGYFYRNVSTLEARDVVSGALKWSFNGDGTLSSAPIVVNGYVYVASNSGKLYALDGGTGANVWTGNLGSPFPHHSEGFDVSVPFPGLGAGNGMIVVPAGASLIAYESATVTPTPTPTPSPIQLLLDASGPALDQVAALDSILFLRDPFPVVNDSNVLNLGNDRNTRVIVFVTNLQLAPGEASTAVVVNLIASNSQVYEVAAEDVRPVPGFDFTQIVFRLPDSLAAGTFTVRVKALGQVSNAGTIRIRI